METPTEVKPPTLAEEINAAMAGKTPEEMAVAEDLELKRSNAPPPMMMGPIELPISALRESGTNPRKRWGELDELTASIKTQGILQRLIVRLVPEGGVEVYQIICGARRFRAGKLAGVEIFPCELVALSDDQVREFQIVENLQRKDLHPIEEAEGFEQMISAGYKVPTIALRVGKSTGWIRLRLQLLKLTPEARAAFFEKRIDPSVAQVLGRQPQAGQGRALIGLERLATVKEQIEYLQNTFAKNLKGAPFDPKDATLPRLCSPDGIGDCASCPNNSNNAPRELFGDYDKIERAGICSDTPCFTARAEAIVERTTEKARARGEKVLTPGETKKVISYGTPVYGSPYVNARDVVPDDPKRRTWEQILAKAPEADRPPVVLAPNDQKPGEMFHLFDRKLAVAAAGALGLKWAKRQLPEEKQVAKSKAKAKAADAQARVIAEVTELAMPQLIAKWRKAAALPALQLLALQALGSLGADDLALVPGWFGFEEKGAAKWIEKSATAPDLIAFVLACNLYPTWQEGGEAFNEDFAEIAKGLGVDLKEITRAQLAAAKAGQVKWKKKEGGEEFEIDGEVYGVSFNGGGKTQGYFYKGPTGSGAACDSIAEGKIKLLALAGITPPPVKPKKGVKA